MDVLVDFCRTGRLGPIEVNLNPIEVERLLGDAQDSRDLHDDPNWQRYRWGSLFLTFRGDYQGTGDLRSLRLSGIRVNLRNHRIELPQSLAAGLTEDWSSHELDLILSRLDRAGAAPIAIKDRQTELAGRLRTYQLGEAGVQLHAVNELVSYVQKTTSSTPTSEEI